MRRLKLLERADDLAEEARKAVGKDMAGATAQRLIVNTLKWELSKLHPEQYGDRIQLEHGGAMGVQIYVGSDDD